MSEETAVSAAPSYEEKRAEVRAAQKAYEDACAAFVERPGPARKGAMEAARDRVQVLSAEAVTIRDGGAS